MRISFYNDNTARNAIKIDINNITFYYSYNTLVAVAHVVPQVIKNYWGPTTGKHLNWIDYGNKKARLTQEEFDKVVKKAMKLAKIKQLPILNIV